MTEPVQTSSAADTTTAGAPPGTSAPAPTEAGGGDTSERDARSIVGEIFAKQRAEQRKQFDAEIERGLEAPAPGDAEAQAPPADGAELQKGAPVSGEEEDPITRALLRSRERAQRERSDAATEAERVRAQAKAEADRILAEAKARREEILRGYEAEARRKVDELLSPEALQARQADQQDPMFRFRQDMQSELHKRDAELAEFKAWRSAQEEQAKQAQARQAEQQQEALNRQFLSVATEEKYPAARTLWSDSALVRECKELCTELVEAGAIQHDMSTGRPVAYVVDDKGNRTRCTDDLLMRYLESRARKHLTKGASKLLPILQQVGGSTGAEKAAPPKSTGQPPRTLSTQHAGERRVTPKSVDEMTDEERDLEMRKAFRKATKASS